MSHNYFRQIPNTASNTPRSRVFLAELSGSQLVKKFPAFYGTRRFITGFTTAGHKDCIKQTKHTSQIFLCVV